MTVNIGFLGDNFSMIASDGRGTRQNKESGYIFTDGLEKLWLERFGWITSQGPECIDDFFIEDIHTYKVHTRNDLYNCYIKSVVDTEKIVGVRRAVASNMMYSLNYIKDSKMNMSIETLDIDFKCRQLKQGVMAVRPPQYTKRIRRLIVEYTEQSRQVKNFYDAIYIIACFVHRLSKLTQFINDTVTYGISYMMPDGELLYMRLQGKAKDIKKLYIPGSEEQPELMKNIIVIPNTGIEKRSE